MLNQVLEVSKGLGLDLTGMFGHVGISADDGPAAGGNGAAQPPPSFAGRTS